MVRQEVVRGSKDSVEPLRVVFHHQLEGGLGQPPGHIQQSPWHPGRVSGRLAAPSQAQLVGGGGEGTGCHLFSRDSASHPHLAGHCPETPNPTLTRHEAKDEALVGPLNQS